MYKTLSQLGRALMLPISVLPIAGLLLGIGGAFTTESAINMIPWLANPVVNGILLVLKNAGNAVFSNIAAIFAVGVAVGFAKEDKGTAALSAVIAYFITAATIVVMTDIVYPDGLEITFDTGVLGSLVSGGTVAWLHNKFHKIQLPDVLGFFSGSRFVPIVSSFAAIIIGLVFFVIWPPIAEGLKIAGEGIAQLGCFGSFIYGFSMRLLGALGLHHAIYPMFWFTSLGGTEVVNGATVSGAQNIFFAQMADPNFSDMFTYGTRFFAGRFPTIMFGVPAACLAMYLAIPKKNRKKNKGIYLSGGLTAFLTGITEPVEYLFLFVAPWLYVVHAVLDGISFMVCDLLQVRIGNAFAAGLFEFSLFGIMQGDSRTHWIICVLLGIVWAMVYFCVFYFLIKKFKVAVPGMLDDEEVEGDKALASKGKKLSKDEQNHQDAIHIIEYLGTTENIEACTACATRLRVSVKDVDKVDDDKLKRVGALAVIKKKDGGVQAVFGVKASLLSDEINTIL